ncbi:MAG TPA: arginase [Gaiellaceae bacterium]|nr:arginase [Gaiellaceae bacterium]
MAEDATRRAAIIGAALDLGAGRRGVDMGPSAIRYAGLEDRLRELGIDCEDWGNVETVVAEATESGSPEARFLPQIKETCERIAGAVARAVREGRTPIVLGGDHSIALGTLGGLASARGPGAVLWFDAHGDLNTPATSPSGNVHGMPLAAALGRDPGSFASEAWPLPAVDSERVVLVGVRSLDEGERDFVRASGIGIHTMSELDRRGIEPVMREALERVAGAPFVHVSLDMDVVDPDMTPGVGTPVRGGLSYREAHLALELVAESGLMSSLEIVEVNPILDRGNETAALAVELAASAFGARIL